MEKVPFPQLLGLVRPWRRYIFYRLRRLGIPAAEVFLYVPLLDWGFVLRAAYVVRKYGLFIFQAEFPAYARIALILRKWFGGFAVLVEHNVEFERIRSQYPEASDAVIERLRNTEVGLCHEVNAVVAVSDQDRATLVREGVDTNKTFLVPHGVDLDAFADALPLRHVHRTPFEEQRNCLVFHGTFNYSPNREALNIIRDQILPRLRRRGLSPIVMAIGANPPNLRPSSDIVCPGEVDSVAPYLKSADAAIVPLMQGGGTRMKLLDYFAAGVPVISTSKGAEGLAVENERQLLIRDDLDAFADAIVELLGSKSKVERLVASARQFVAHSDWSTISQQYADIYEQPRACRRYRKRPARGHSRPRL
jgi:glycosyltransferase involved in cell wall biosynthesis